MTASGNERSALRVAGLFAGIGGFELGFSRAGHETVFLCEIEPGARAVLETQFEGTKLHDDVSDLVALPEVDLVTAGFPCQDLSQAGPTAGIEGAKSRLVGEVWRLLEPRRVPWVVLENVPFMLRLNKGRALEVVVSSLERLGYRWAYRVVDTRAFGLPQRRERVFIVAAQDDDPRTVLFADDEGPPVHQTTDGKSFGFYWTEGNTGVGWAVEAIPPLKGGSGWGIPSPPAMFLTDADDFVMPDIRDAERLQGFPSQWTRAAEDILRPSHRWKLVGNAVSVPVAAWLGHRLRRPGVYDAANDKELTVGTPWPRAAWGDGAGKRYAATVSAWPKRYKWQPLHDFINHEGRRLTYRAAFGFLTRARAAETAGHLRFREGFLEALERFVERSHTAPRVRKRA